MWRTANLPFSNESAELGYVDPSTTNSGERSADSVDGSMEIVRIMLDVKGL